MVELCGASFGNTFNKAKPYLLTVGLQFGIAGAYIFSMASLNHGMSRFVFVVYRNVFAAFALAPLALIFERKIRPKMTISVFIQIMVLGFLEPVIDQGFTFLGMQYTSASFASAIMNAVPSITFVLAVLLRLERVKIKEVRSLAKVIGTLVTFAGALVMTLYKGHLIHLFYSSNTTHHQDVTHSPQSLKHWVSGTLFLILGCVAWASFIILQSITIKRYPAELSLSSLICVVGSLQAAVVALVAEHHSGLRAWAIGWDFSLYGPLYTVSPITSHYNNFVFFSNFKFPLHNRGMIVANTVHLTYDITHSELCIVILNKRKGREIETNGNNGDMCELISLNLCWTEMGFVNLTSLLNGKELKTVYVEFHRYQGRFSDMTLVQVETIITTKKEVLYKWKQSIVGAAL